MWSLFRRRRRWVIDRGEVLGENPNGACLH